MHALQVRVVKTGATGRARRSYLGSKARATSLVEGGVEIFACNAELTFSTIVLLCRAAVQLCPAANQSSGGRADALSLEVSL
jgi:hypothetical protein